MNKEHKAKELIAQFGPNAKYVVCEIMDEIKKFGDPIFIKNRLEYWQEVKSEIVKLKTATQKSCVETCEKWQTLAKQKIHLQKQVEELEQQLINAGLKKPAIRVDLSHNA